MTSGEYIDGLKQKLEMKDRSLVRLAAELEKANARIRELEAELTATRLALVKSPSSYPPGY